MHIKFLKHGTGSAKKAADYLVGDKDHAGRERSGVKVLRGDPVQVAAVADSLSFKHKYRSGVISFAPEDRPTDQQLKEVLDDFEATAWAGLDPDRYTWSAILHNEKNGGCHVHIFTARCDLVTGKSMNIAPPGWLKMYDPLRDFYNHRYGWARPDDPERARLCQPGPHVHVRAAQLRAGMEVEPDPRQLVTDFIVDRIESGAIENRADILAALHGAGLETPRAGKKYITVLDPDTGNKFRLKGLIYNADFEREQFTRKASAENGTGSTAGGRINKRRGKIAFKELEKQRQKRAAYNQGRFPGDSRQHQRGHGRTSDGDPEQNHGIFQGEIQALDSVDADRPVSLSRHLSQQLGADAISIPPDQKSTLGGHENLGMGNTGLSGATVPSAAAENHPAGRLQRRRKKRLEGYSIGSITGVKKPPSRGQKAKARKRFKRFKITLELAFKKVEKESGVVEFQWNRFPDARPAFFETADNKIVFNSLSRTAIKAGVQRARQKGWETLKISSSDAEYVHICVLEALAQGFEIDDLSFEGYVPSKTDLRLLQNEVQINQKELKNGKRKLRRNARSLQQPGFRKLGKLSGHCMRQLSACNLAHHRKKRSQGVLPRDARLDRREPESVRWQGEVTGGLNRIRTELNQVNASAERNNQRLAYANVEIKQACSRIDRCLQKVTPALLRRTGEQVMNNELDMFKRDIDLVEYAAGQGFEVDRKKSATTTTIMRNGASVVIGISKSRQGHHIYNCFTGSDGGGSVIDFVKKVQGVPNLGYVRKELRSYLGSPRPEIRNRNLPKPQQRPPRAERKKFLQEDLKAARPMTQSSYLESRGISQETLGDPRYPRSRRSLRPP